MLEQNYEHVYYDTAQICTNGHLVNTHVKTSPSLNKNYCAICGAEAISKCPKCQSPIKGCHHVVVHEIDSIDWITSKATPTTETHCQRHEYVIPAYCDNCSAPYPWTQSLLDELDGIIDMDDVLSIAEKTILKEQFPKILVKQPGSNLAVIKIKKYLPSAAKYTIDVLKDTLSTKLLDEGLKRLFDI